MSLDLVATCALGLEEIVEAELAELGMEGVRGERGAVAFRGGWTEVWRANWRLRAANRVLVVLAAWDAADGPALAAGARALVRSAGRRGEPVWDGVSAAALFDPVRTFAIRATSSASQVRDVRWAALNVKDGLVDGQRERFGRRASVERREPDLALRLWLREDRATLLLDTSGEPLDRRGYRLERTAAPLRENLAAACVLASGWDGRGPVVDPMCGSGTLLAEAGAFAAGRAPGATRVGWGFERLPGFDAAVFAAVCREPVPAPGTAVRLYGVDLAPKAVAAARSNLERAGLGDRATLMAGDGFEYEPPPGPGLLVVNPPYGERLAEAPEQWRRLGDLLKRRYVGWRAVVLAGDASRGKWIGLRPRRRLPMRNGPLDARILVFDLY
jgi:23S rRNA (guanine2445-N2)-methyltransferase